MKYTLPSLALLAITHIASAGEAVFSLQDADLSNAERTECGGFIPLSGGLNVELDEPFPISAGSFSTWIRPLNWDGGTEKMVHLFSVLGEGLWWNVYKYQIDHNKLGLCFLFGLPSPNGENDFTFISTPIDDWITNDWRHITVTWSGDDRMVHLYVDGALKAESDMKEKTLPYGEHITMKIALHNNIPGGDVFRTEFDAARLYRTVLSADKIAELAEKKPTETAP